MRIGVLTGGGDVPGLNPCIKAVVDRVIHDGHDVIGIRRGWGGLLEYDLDDPASHDRSLQPLDLQTVRTIDRTGGTFLHTSRTNPGRVRPEDVPRFLEHRADGEVPRLIPALTHARGRVVSGQLKLAVPVAIRLLSVGSEKVRPAGAHVASDVFHGRRDAVDLWPQLLE
jgi:hypothetical protein